MVENSQAAPSGEENSGVAAPESGSGDELTEVNSAEAASASKSAEQSSPSGRARRKQREGVVVSVSMNRTAVVLLTERVRHRSYGKIVRRHKRLYVHDERNEAALGDLVRVIETRPISKMKRWRLVEILERAR